MTRQGLINCASSQHSMNTQRCNRCIRHGLSCTLLRTPTTVQCAQCASNRKRCLFVREYENRMVATTATTWADRDAETITHTICGNAGTNSDTASKTKLFIRIPPRRVLTTAASVQQERSAEPVVVRLFWILALAVIQPLFLQNPSVKQRERVSAETEHRVNLGTICLYSWRT